MTNVRRPQWKTGKRKDIFSKLLAFSHWLFAQVRIERMIDFIKYEVWQLAIDLAVKVYQTTKTFPEGEKFGLTSQLRRAVISISSNIAESASRSSDKEFKRFIEIAIGSLFDIKSQLIVSHKLIFSATNPKYLSSMKLI